MRMTILQMLLVPLFFSTTLMVSADWCYPIHGSTCVPWSPTYPACGAGNQSPLALDFASAVVNPELEPFDFSGYVVPSFGIDWLFINTGHSVVIEVGTGVKLQGGGLSGPYDAISILFHWGSNNTEGGAEHVVDGLKLPLEMQIIHIMEVYGNLTEARNYEDGVAILAIQFRVGKHNEAFKDMISVLNDIKYKDEGVYLKPVALSSFLPLQKGFFRYTGSLTTPPCSTGVIWSVFRSSAELSQEQLFAFYNLFYTVRGDEDTNMVDNFRSLQTLGDRVVNFSSAAICFSVQFLLPLLPLLLLMI